MLIRSNVALSHSLTETDMILSTCAGLMQTAADEGKDEESAIMTAHAFVKAHELPKHETEYAMSEIRAIAAKIYETALVE